jgi:hypothetical protein
MSKVEGWEGVILNARQAFWTLDIRHHQNQNSGEANAAERIEKCAKIGVFRSARIDSCHSGTRPASKIAWRDPA